MISVEEAVALVLERAGPRASLGVPPSAALGLVLAEDVVSDFNCPPHDKSMVDGYAVVAGDVRRPGVELAVLEQVTAGATPTRRVASGYTTCVMTGAPIPDGADAVVMIERTELADGGGETPSVRIRESEVRRGQNIMRQGESVRRGEVVLRAGQTIRPIEIGLLAEIGATRVSVHPQPTVALLATGNELVPADSRPAAGQIRNSNGPMLGALVARAGGRAVDLGIGRDDKRELSQLVHRGLEQDLLVLSGGVSAGVLDLVPEVLSSLGAEQVFHKVNLKPGKPVWFGALPAEEGNKLVFGLPGNPVSTLVCFELFVRPALARLAGRGDQRPDREAARLSRDHRHHGDRPTYYPARLEWTGGEPLVEPLAWKGSADLRTLADANCLAFFPAGDHQFNAGDRVTVFPL